MEVTGQIPTKRCTKCKEDKPLTAYVKRGKGHYSQCKACASVVTKLWRAKSVHKTQPYRRKYHLKQFFNMTEDDYNKLYAAQNGVCAICKTADPGNRHRSFNLNVDHDHLTGKVRGLLCTPCNHGLGKFKDSPELLTIAKEYLEKH